MPFATVSAANAVMGIKAMSMVSASKIESIRFDFFCEMLIAAFGPPTIRRAVSRMADWVVENNGSG